MTFNIELTGEQVHTVRMALIGKSNKAYQDGDIALSTTLDAVECSIIDQCIEQREETVC